MRLYTQTLAKGIVVYICEQKVGNETYIAQALNPRDAMRECLKSTKPIKKNHLEVVRNDGMVY